jgi:putative MATE family efflux protein
MASRAARDLTQGPVFGHIRRLVVPMSFGIMAMMLTGVIDAYWVGKLGTAQLAAVSFVFPISMAVMSVAIGLGAGAVSVVARSAGRGDTGQVRRVTTDAVLLSFLVVAVLSVLGRSTITPLFTAMGATPDMLPHVQDYMSVWFTGIVFIAGPMIASNILRALGDAVVPSVLMMLSAAINMILDPFLIFGWGPFPEMGVTGAALATVIGNFISFLIVMAPLAFGEQLIDPRFPGWSALVSNWREIARVGAPAAASNMINPLSMAVVFAAVARFGEGAVAGFGVAGRVEAFAIIPLFALSASVGPITGQNGGAGLTDRVREAFVKAFIFCAAWTAGVTVLLWAAGPWIAAAFLPSDAGQDTAQLYWWIATPTVFGYGVCMAASAGLNGLGRPLYGMMLHVIRCIVLLAPLAWIGASLGGVTGLLIGAAAANLIAAVVAVGFILTRAPMTAVGGSKGPAAAPAPASGRSAPAGASALSAESEPRPAHAGPAGVHGQTGPAPSTASPSDPD